MRRVLILSVCVLLGFACVAQAGLVTTYTGPVNVTAVDDSSNVSYDKVTLTISGFPGSNSTDKVMSLAGIFSVTGPAGTGFILNSNLTDDTTSANKLTTYVNLPSNLDTLYDGTTPSFTTPTGTGVYSAFGDMWYSGTTSKFLAQGVTLAVLEVSKGWTGITFDGVPGDANNPSIIGTVLASGPETIHVAVPEPGTLALLGCGLFGLLAYAWRKRK